MEERLQKFATLVELGSYTGAAESLHLSQPALSAAIKKLERELKQPLLEHGTRPLKLTTAGQFAYATAKELSVVTNNLSYKLNQLKQQKPNLTIGMIDSVAHAVFSYSNAFDELQRVSKLSLIVNNTRYLIDAIQRNTLDMAIVVEPKKSRANSANVLKTRYIGSEPLLIACHKDFYLKALDSVSKHKLNSFISYDRPSNTYRLISEALARNDVKVSPTFYSTSPEINLQLVAMGKGVSVLPYLSAKDLLIKKEIRPLSIGGSSIIERRVALVKHHGKELPEFAEEFVNQVRDTLSKLREEATEIDN